MKIASELPHVMCDTKSGGAWRILLSEEKSFEAAWTEGRAFWWGLNIYHERVVVKLADVIGMLVLSEDSIALRDADQEEIKSRELLQSDD